MKEIITNHKDNKKSYRQSKAEELSKYAEGLDNDDLDREDQERLIHMLRLSAENLIDINDQWMIKASSLQTMLTALTESFFYLQDALEVIDDDPFVNEWRCSFSNRLMHKSMKLQSFKKQVIHIQKNVYNILFNLVENPFEHIVEASENEMGLVDFKFYINEVRSTRR